MATKTLICPDCGGVIGAKEVTDEGKPCACFSNLKVGEHPNVVGAGPNAKVCWKCGKDVSGKRRLRDSMGYWCYDCHKADQAANRPKGVKCEDCGRLVSEKALSDYNGMMICRACRSDRRRMEKRKRKFDVVSTSAHDQQEKKRLIILAAVFMFLVAVIVLHRCGIIGNFF